MQVKNIKSITPFKFKKALTYEHFKKLIFVSIPETYEH